MLNPPSPGRRWPIELTSGPGARISGLNGSLPPPTLTSSYPDTPTLPPLLPAPRFSAYIHQGPHLLAFSPTTGTYYKVTEDLASGGLLLPAPNIGDGSPAFTICVDCTQIVREYLAWRHRNPDFRVASVPLDSLEALWHALLVQERLKKTPSAVLGPPPTLSQFPSAPHRSLAAMAPIPSLVGYIVDTLKSVSAATPPDSSPRSSPSASRHAAGQAASRTWPEHYRPGASHPVPTTLAGTACPFLALPSELIQMIGTHLPTTSLYALRQTGCAAAAHFPLDSAVLWRDQLLSGQLFGFFFVFELSGELGEIAQRLRGPRKPSPAQKPRRPFAPLRPLEPRAAGVPGDLDWRALVGLLAKYENFRPGGTLHGAPANFRLRRYVWRNLELFERRMPVTEYFAA